MIHGAANALSQRIRLVKSELDGGRADIEGQKHGADYMIFMMTDAITLGTLELVFPRLRGKQPARPRGRIGRPGAPSVPRVTVWYDGGCPLCLREIALMRRLDRRGAIDFVDLTDGATTCPIDRAELLARFHAREGNGPLVSGAAAFAAMWRAIPALAWAGHLARAPLAAGLLEIGYRFWLRVRPALQRALRGRAVSVDASPPPRL